MHHLFGLSCKDITRLVSESMDHTLPLIQRIKIRIHLGMCKYCARFEKQVRLLRTVYQKHEKVPSEAALSAKARERIRHALHASAADQ
jgi:predicted anti-sigma-YlaC factor YlaD